MEVIVKNEEETKRQARSVLKEMIRKKDKAASVVALSGELGSGKTVFAKGLAEALGISERVISPTFVIERRYETSSPGFPCFIHIDAYRLNSSDDMNTIDWPQKLKDPDNLICLEWPENVCSVIPPDSLKINFEVVSEKKRLLKIFYD
ncbi:MAG: tRNA (adenosine(37)-N6)-threonylcarbamoyltransferase complex ATPase subunit type 1 TsaE [Candidatus Paceibacterota bacterium]